MLARKLEEGARAAEAEAAAAERAKLEEARAKEAAKAPAAAERQAERAARAAERARSTSSRSRSRAKDKGLLEQVMGSPAVRDMARTAGRAIVRSLFGTWRRR